jgi:hypothetical protein
MLLRSVATFRSMAVMTDTPWQIVPQSFFSRHFDLIRGGQTIASLRMAFLTEGCEFSIAGHQFAIRRKSLWVDGFQLFAGDESVCEVRRGFWSRRFEIMATLDDAYEHWVLQPVGFFTRTHELLAGEQQVGTVRPAGWFSRRRIGDFTDDVPLPVQVLAIFLVLLVSQRQQKRNAPGPGI